MRGSAAKLSYQSWRVGRSTSAADAPGTLRHGASAEGARRPAVDAATRQPSRSADATPPPPHDADALHAPPLVQQQYDAATATLVLRRSAASPVPLFVLRLPMAAGGLIMLLLYCRRRQ